MVNFTDRYIKSLKPKEKDYEVNGGGGFYIRIRKNGKMSWIYRFHFGKPQRMTLGSYPSLSLKAARAKHREAVDLLDQGINPIEHKKAEKLTRKKSPTVADLVDEYMTWWAKPNKKSWEADQRIFDVDVLPKIGDMIATEVTRPIMISILREIAERGAPNQSWQTLKVSRKMFNFAVENGRLEHNPCANIKPVVKLKAKDRWLAKEEIRWI